MKLINIKSAAAKFADTLETSHCASLMLLQTVNELVKAQSREADFEALAKEFGDAVNEAVEGLGVSPATLKVYVSQARRVIRGAVSPDGRKVATNCETQGFGIQRAASLMPSQGGKAGGRPSKGATVSANSGTGEAVEFAAGETTPPKTVMSGLDTALGKIAGLAKKDTNMEAVVLLLAKNAEFAEQISNWLVTTKFGAAQVTVAEKLRKAA
jgi:hypothetical protein